MRRVISFCLFTLLFSCASTLKVKDDGKFFGNFNPITPDEKYSMKSENPWHGDAVFYHIWVKAFSDSNGDGIGDIKGIIQKLDYLNDGDPTTFSDLGVTGIWLSPIFECDFKGDNMHGYDTVDYYKINEKFGTEADVIELLAEAHKRGIRIIFDYVVNHTSSKHPWFLDSNNGGEKRDWYIWKKNPSKEDTKTKKWQRAWGGGNWTNVWHRYADSYYYGAFWSGMPDLNLKNKDTREEMANVLIYWLNKGFDGVRIDAVRYISEDGPDSAADRPDTHVFFKKMRGDIFEKYNSTGYAKMMVGEAWTDKDKILPYYGNGTDELHMCFDFPMAYTIRDTVKSGDRSAAKVENLNNYFEYVENTLPKGAVNASFLTNHDEVASRPFTDYGGNIDKCILSAGLAILAHGTPFIYNGNELGMADGDAKGDMKHRTRIELEKIEDLSKDKDSILSWHKYFIKLKKTYSALRTGSYKRVPTDDGKTLAFLRYNDGESLLIVANFNKENKSVSLDFSGIDVPKGDVTLLLGKTAGGNLSLTDENFSKFALNDMEPASIQVYVFGAGERVR